jgi:hypothetical protein
MTMSDDKALIEEAARSENEWVRARIQYLQGRLPWGRCDE